MESILKKSNRLNKVYSTNYIDIMVEQILNDYIFFIKNFEKVIREKYDIKKSDRILSGIGVYFQREGEIDEYKYRFHGAGCCIEKDGITCDYDYSVNNISLSLWKFKQFIMTHPKYKNGNLSDNYLEIELYHLIEKGKLSWMTWGGTIWQVYEYII